MCIPQGRCNAKFNMENMIWIHSLITELNLAITEEGEKYMSPECTKNYN